MPFAFWVIEKPGERSPRWSTCSPVAGWSSTSCPWGTGSGGPARRSWPGGAVASVAGAVLRDHVAPDRLGGAEDFVDSSRQCPCSSVSIRYQVASGSAICRASSAGITVPPDSARVVGEPHQGLERHGDVDDRPGVVRRRQQLDHFRGQGGAGSVGVGQLADRGGDLEPAEDQVDRDVGTELFEGALVAARTQRLGDQAEPVVGELDLVGAVVDVEVAHPVLGVQVRADLAVLERLVKAVLGFLRAEAFQLVVQLVAQLLRGPVHQPRPTASSGLGVVGEAASEPAVNPHRQGRVLLGPVECLPGGVGDQRRPCRCRAGHWRRASTRRGSVP